MRLRLISCAAALLFAASLSAKAAILYDVTTFLPDVYTPFEYTFSEPTFLTATTSISGQP